MGGGGGVNCSLTYPLYPVFIDFFYVFHVCHDHHSFIIDGRNLFELLSKVGMHRVHFTPMFLTFDPH